MVDDSDSFFVADGDAFVATTHTQGPWAHGFQHGGPPSALAARELERRHPRPDLQTVRMTVELLRPVPIGRFEIATEVLRGGRRVEHLAAVVHVDGQEALRVTSWRIRTADVPLDAGRDPATLPPPAEVDATPPFFPGAPEVGYHLAMESRFVHGGWTEHGPATAWLRMRIPLLPDEAPTPLQRVMCAADSGNGVSASFAGTFVNPDLTVYLTHLPAGEWVALQARTILTDHGIGLADTVLHDEVGPIGRSLQSLYLDHTPGPGA